MVRPFSYFAIFSILTDIADDQMEVDISSAYDSGTLARGKILISSFQYLADC